MDSFNKQNVCRTCLGEATLLRSVFTIEGSDTISFADIINTSISSRIHITENDGLPDKICESCSAKVLEFHKFKLDIEKNEVILKSEIEKHSANYEGENSLIKKEIIFHEELDGNESNFDHFNSLSYKNETQEVEQEFVCVQTDFNIVKNEGDCSLKQEQINDYEKGIDEFNENEDNVINNDVQNENVDQCESSSQGGGSGQSECQQSFHNNEKSGKSKKRYKTKYVKNYEEKQFVCGYCNKKFGSKTTLENHIKIHTGQNLFECDKCGKKCTTKFSLKGHLMTHIQEKLFECGHCNKKFSTNGTLRSHLKIHTGEDLFECNYCNKKFTKLFNYKRHLVIHGDEKMFQCEHCKKKFKDQSNLRKHLKKYTGINLLECNECNIKFVSKCTLNTHLLAHGRKQHKCDYCNKKFTTKFNLNTHLTTHMDIKPFECEHCNKTYRRSSDLKAHIKSSHSEEMI